MSRARELMGFSIMALSTKEHAIHDGEGKCVDIAFEWLASLIVND